MLQQPQQSLSSPPPPQDKVVTVHTLAHEAKSDRVRYSGARSKIAGWMLIIGGCTSVLLGGLLLWACSLAGVAGAGFWGGSYITAGALGVIAGKEKSKGYITGFLVMSILALIIGCGVITVTAIALAFTDSTGTYYCNNYSSFDTRSTVMECLMLIVAMLLLLVTMWAVSISCRTVCCGKLVMEHPQTASEVKYSEPQDMILTSSRPPSAFQKPGEKSAPPSANTSREHFQFPPPKELQYSYDSQYMSQYSQHDSSNQQHQTSQYSQGAPVQYNNQPYNPNAPNTPQYASPQYSAAMPQYPQQQFSQNSQYSQNPVPSPQYSQNAGQGQYYPQNTQQQPQQQQRGSQRGRQSRETPEQNFY